MESMIGQYKIDRLPYDADLCFTIHKLVEKIDEDGPVYYGERKHQIRQKLIESLGFLSLKLILT